MAYMCNARAPQRWHSPLAKYVEQHLRLHHGVQCEVRHMVRAADVTAAK
jgi:hypothetical protein